MIDGYEDARKMVGDHPEFKAVDLGCCVMSSNGRGSFKLKIKDTYSVILFSPEKAKRLLEFMQKELSGVPK